MSILEAIILAIIEGLTEFLPVSSTGHIIIGSSMMNIADQPFTKAYTIVIQLGAILSVVVLYWREFVRSIRFYYTLAIGLTPAIILGLLLNDHIDRMLERVDIVGFTLVGGGIFFLFVDKLFESNETDFDQRVTYSVALKIGLFQCLAMVPGVSRSAATIIGGLSQRLNKKKAAEFSFFLAVPTMFAATAYKMFSFIQDEQAFSPHEINLLIIGNVVSFIVALIAIRSFIKFLTNHGFKFFGYYRIIVGLILLILYYAGIDLSVV